MSRARAALVLVLLAPALGPGPAAALDAGAWWDEAWAFRLPLVVSPEGRDALGLGQVSLRGVEDAVLWVPLDLTAALRATADQPGGGWPFDAAGRPLGWTLDPDSVRVVEPGPDGAPVRRGGRDVLAARFLPMPLEPAGPGLPPAPYDAQTHAAGVLVVLLPGPFDAPRQLHLYFDSVERGGKARPMVSASEEARLAQLGTFGPGAAFLARVPPAPAEGTMRLVAMALPGEPTSLGAERLADAAAPEVLVPAGTPVDGVARFALPGSAEGYDLRVRATRPLLLALETEAPGRPAAAFVFPSAQGGAAGTRFLLTGLAGATASPSADVIGAGGRAEVVVRDAATGAEVAAFQVARQSAQPLAIPRGARYALTASADVLVLARGGADARGSGFLVPAVSLGGGLEGTFLVGQRAAGHAATGEVPAGVTAYPLARPAEALRGRIGEPPRLAWVAKGSAAVTSEPWAFAADAPATALLGSEGYAAWPAEAGADGRFHLRVPVAPDAPDAAGAPPLQAALLAPFPGTDVQAEVRAVNGSLLASAATTLAGGASLRAFPDGKRPLLEEGTVLTLAASRPFALAVLRPEAPANAFLPGLPAVPGVAASPLEYRGSLLLWGEALRLAEARPGERAAVRLELTNLGRAADGTPLVDDVALRAEPVAGSALCPAAWDASLVQAALPAFRAPETREVAVLVDVPADAAPGACSEVRVLATSGREPGVVVEARVLVRSRSGFEPVLEVLDGTGSPGETALLVLEPGVAARVGLRLRNTGAEAGRARLAFAPGPGFEASLALENGTQVAGADGRSALAVPVAAGATVALRFDARAAAAGPVGWDVPVEAVSEADPAARDQVTIAVLPRSDVRLVATPDARRLAPTPGGNHSLGLHLRNLGDDVEVRVRPATPLPEGWALALEPDRVLLRPAGARDPDGAPLDQAGVRVTLRAPADAKVGQAQLVDLLVEPSQDPAAAVRLAVQAVVANDFLLAPGEVPAVVAGPAGEVLVPLRLASRAAGPFEATLRGIRAPGGWAANLTGLPVPVAPGEARDLHLRLQLPPGAKAGAHTVLVELDLADGTSPPARAVLPVNATTPSVAVLRLEGLPVRATLAANASLRLPATVVNDGNRPAQANPVLAAGALAGVLEPAGPWLVGPGARQRVDLVLDAPPQPGFRAAEVALEVRAADTTARAEVEVVEAAQDLVLERAVASAQAGGAFVRVTVANRGSLEVPGVRVELLAPDGPAGNATLAALLPGRNATHVLAAPAGATALRVRVSSADGAPDAAPEDNEVAVQWAAARPAPGFEAAVLVLASLALLARRRRR